MQSCMKHLQACAAALSGLQKHIFQAMVGSGAALAPVVFPALPLTAAGAGASCDGAAAAARVELRCFCLRLATAAASSCAPALWPKRGSVGSSAKAGLLKMAEKRASSQLCLQESPQLDAVGEDLGRPFYQRHPVTCTLHRLGRSSNTSVMDILSHWLKSEK